MHANISGTIRAFEAAVFETGFLQSQASDRRRKPISSEAVSTKHINALRNVRWLFEH